MLKVIYSILPHYQSLQLTVSNCSNQNLNFRYILNITILIIFTSIFEYKLKKRKYCGWDSNLGLQMEDADGSTDLWRWRRPFCQLSHCAIVLLGTKYPLCYLDNLRNVQ